jgi:hypothetical protein
MGLQVVDILALVVPFHQLAPFLLLAPITLLRLHKWPGSMQEHTWCRKSRI